MSMSVPRPLQLRAAAIVAAFGLLAAVGCESQPPALPDAGGVVTALVNGLEAGTLAAVPFAGSAQAAQTEYETVTAGLGGVHPTVMAGAITYDQQANSAIVELATSYALGASAWTYTSSAQLVYGGTPGWRVVWSPTIVFSRLDGYTRLSLTSTPATRGQITGENGQQLVWNRPVFQVGIDKSKVSGAQAEASARALAAAVGVNADAYAKQVAAGGAIQFVVAITLRAEQVPAAVDTIPGALAQGGTMSLGPSPTFAIGLLGSAGAATADDIKRSNGTLQADDTVGHTGLQAKYDAFLRGTDGYTVWLAPRSADSVTKPSADATATPAPTPSTERVPLWGVDPVAGGTLNTTLDEAAQTKAEAVLAGQSGIAALVVLDAKTGAIRAAANSPAAGANPYATQGRYAPGSTFKVATTLAAMRNGMTPDSPVDCPTTVTVDGKQFKNVTGYSPQHNGTITMREAVAYSCNTAMVNISQKLPAGALVDAAASLGIGNQADLGFNSFLGEVPQPSDSVTAAADSFGQGDVLASPLAMATEAASVAAGRTITPYLLVPTETQSPQPSATSSDSPTPAVSSPAAPTLPASELPPTALPTSTATPLSAQEASWLQSEMEAVVTLGSGSVLKGLVTGAKSGTAEFTQDGQTLTHAWFIAYNNQYAIAAYVDQGVGGATTAAPLIKAFLS